MNILNIIGNLASDPETHFSKSGTSITKFRVADNWGYGKNAGVNWITCVSFNENPIFQHLKKGSSVFISGEFRIREYPKQDGSTGVSNELMLNSVSFAPGGQKQDSAASKPSRQTNDEMDDDIPF